MSLLQPKWGGQGSPRVLASSATLSVPGGEVHSALSCRVKGKCHPLPRGHPRPRPQLLRIHRQLARADLKPSPRSFRLKLPPQGSSRRPQIYLCDNLCLPDRKRQVEARCSDKELLLWAGSGGRATAHVRAARVYL